MLESITHGALAKCIREADVPVPVMEMLLPVLKYFRYATRITLSFYAGRPSISGVSLEELTAIEERIAFGHGRMATAAWNLHHRIYF